MYDHQGNACHIKQFRQWSNFLLWYTSMKSSQIDGSSEAAHWSIYFHRACSCCYRFCLYIAPTAMFASRISVLKVGSCEEWVMHVETNNEFGRWMVRSQSGTITTRVVETSVQRKQWQNIFKPYRTATLRFKKSKGVNRTAHLESFRTSSKENSYGAAFSESDT